MYEAAEGINDRGWKPSGVRTTPGVPTKRSPSPASPRRDSPTPASGWQGYRGGDHIIAELPDRRLREGTLLELRMESLSG
jgi:hypothetical protein